MTAFAWYWLPPLAWMTMIWGLSTDIGSAASTGRLFIRIVSALAPWATPAQIELAHFLVRKLGHLTEYAVLALLWFRALHAERGLRPSASAWAAVAVSVAWAILDELHQLAVPSRTASPVDVAIDAAGATLAALVVRLRAWTAVRPSGGDRAYPAARPRTG